MRMCSFCGVPAELTAGRLALCEACGDALRAVSPEDPRYAWFSGAVRRALFGGVSSPRRPAFRSPDRPPVRPLPFPSARPE